MPNGGTSKDRRTLMNRLCWITIFVVTSLWPGTVDADNLAKDIKKAAERSTLDQPGNKPFHLKATVAPSFERDKESGRPRKSSQVTLTVMPSARVRPATPPRPVRR
jgi:hypothetical protein